MNDYIDISIENLRKHEPAEGYYLAFSGGKDSIVIKQLAIDAGVKFDAHYNVTTIDPPELIHFIRKYHYDVIWDRPETHFLKMLVRKGFPIRQKRWCCKLYKERYGDGRIVITGIRREESRGRAERQLYEKARDKNKMFLNPIIEWDSEQVWQFIKNKKLNYCSLYDEGFHRVGCVFCPYKSFKLRKKELLRYPGYEKTFRRAFNQLYKEKLGKWKNMERWKDGDEMFNWWLTGKMNNENQQSLFAQG